MAKTKRHFDEKGQAIIEAIAVFIFISTLFLGISSTAYLIYAKQVSGFAMQKSLLCLETVNAEKRTCKRKLTSQVQRFLFLNKNTSVSLKKLTTKNKASVEFTFMKKKFNWSQELIKNKDLY